jgi:arylsulfatase A-like enzyme
MPRPNIVFILIDDMGWMDLGCQGSSFYETPNLDALAMRGMRFTDGYASCPVCSPTRASILTGRYPATVQITNFIYGQARGKLLSAPYLDHLPLEETTVATTLGDGGYSTWHVGKWHLGGEDYWPDKHGFEKNIGGCQWGLPKQGYFSPYGCPTLSDGPEGEYLTDRLTDEAIALIRNRSDKPFFLNLCHYAVHTPIQAPQHLVEKYKRKAASLGLDKKDPLEYGDPFPTEHKKDKRITRRKFQSDPVYAAMVQNLDDNIGKLVEALEAEGIMDDTLLVFTSDNGGLATAEGSPTCNAPLAEGKGWMYEGGTREPMIVCWPGTVPADRFCDVPVSSVDFFPTFCEVAHLDVPAEADIEGVSILDLFKGGGQLDREAIYWHYPHYANQGGRPGCSVRSGDWKLIEFFEDNHVELYNLREDVSEENDLAADQPELAKRLRTMLQQWLEKVDAKIPESNPDWP